MSLERYVRNDRALSVCRRRVGRHCCLLWPLIRSRFYSGFGFNRAHYRNRSGVIIYGVLGFGFKRARITTTNKQIKTKRRPHTMYKTTWTSKQDFNLMIDSSVNCFKIASVRIGVFIKIEEWWKYRSWQKYYEVIEIKLLINIKLKCESLRTYEYYITL